MSAESSLPAVRPLWRTGYILSANADAVWFLALPFAAIAAAFACYYWLPAVALASVTLWVTIPHHFATWMRAYGLAEDRRRWIGPLTVGPLVIFATSLVAVRYAPITLILLAILWDKQHVLMQQHGFARIYDYKARTGAPSTARFDLILNWVLFGNLFISSPFFPPLWLRDLYRLHVPLTASTVQTVHSISWSVTAAYVLVYLGHVMWCVHRGYSMNPVKYAFLAGSYFLWYYTAWHVASALVFAIAGQLMHGIQYFVISYAYTQRRIQQSASTGLVASLFLRPGSVLMFLCAAGFYAIIYQLIIGEPLAELGFGVIHLQRTYPAVPSANLGPMSEFTAYDLFAAAVVKVASMTHYYLDSFIWKISDAKTREGL
jgi:hypothetical protein